MDHMPRGGNAMKLTLCNVAMKACRLPINIDEPVIVAGDDADGHLQASIGILEIKSVGKS